MKQAREHWGSRLGFIMAAAGSAIGLGSLWRFPYITGQNGGGIFVILYLAFTFLIALPVFIGELVVGRHTQRSAITAFSDLSNHSPNWKLLGWLNVLTSFLILSYYCVVSGWCVNYIFMSLNHFTHGRTPEEIAKVFDTLYVSGDISLFWTFIFILFNVGVVFGGIRKGIEHWSRILTPALLFILLGLFAYSTTLDGFGQAFRFIFYPDISKLTASSILNALGMAFFTLSVGLGIILTYGSYMKQTEDIPKTGMIVSSMTLLVSFMSALMIFPIIFTFNLEPQAGAGLVFKTLPVLFAKLPGTLVISTVFFMLLVFTALTSSISLFEVLVSNLIEIFNWTRIKALMITALGIFVVAIPSALAGSGALFSNWKKMYGKDFFDTMDYVTGSWMLPIAALLTTIFIGWVMQRQTAYEEFLKGTTLIRWMRPWFFAIRYVAPIAILLIILQEGGIIDINLLVDYCRFGCKQ
ncbi:MAG: sodium-dependent transporter [Verrucomicrobia bacterium]|nr:sodium-dependent transporter [Verrucomicrobiota bacterium]